MVQGLDELMYRIIRGRRASGERRDDLLDMLLAAQDEDTGEKMSDKELRDEILTMLAAKAFVYNRPKGGSSCALHRIRGVRGARAPRRDRSSRTASKR